MSLGFNSGPQKLTSYVMLDIVNFSLQGLIFTSSEVKFYGDNSKKKKKLILMECIVQAFLTDNPILPYLVANSYGIMKYFHVFFSLTDGWKLERRVWVLLSISVFLFFLSISCLQCIEGSQPTLRRQSALLDLLLQMLMISFRNTLTVLALFEG